MTDALPTLTVVGLMSGTSCDGIDAVKARFGGAEEGLEWEVLDRASLPYDAPLRERLLQALNPATSDVLTLTQLHAELGELYADLAETLLPFDLAALSGQTVYHIPHADAARGWRGAATLQLGEAARVAERVRRPVWSGFRQSDMAAGGQGAPLVAFADLKLFLEPGRALGVHNLGGISNLTYLPPDGNPEHVAAFDTGPGNCLLDEAAAHFFSLPYDAGGRLAAQGQVSETALRDLLTHPYYARPYPKTTGRETFNLAAVRGVLMGLSGHDVLATLTALTAETVARSYRVLAAEGRAVQKVLVAGGGTANDTLMRALGARLNVSVEPLNVRGATYRDREALCFALLGFYAACGLPNTLPSATGARRAVVAGTRTGGA